jgi:hypothetical protein
MSIERSFFESKDANKEMSSGNLKKRDEADSIVDDRAWEREERERTTTVHVMCVCKGDKGCVGVFVWQSTQTRVV